MERVWRFAILFFLAFLYLGSSAVYCLRFEMKSGQTKCVAEEIQANVLVLGTYHVLTPGIEEHHVTDAHKIFVRVTSPYGSTLHYGDKVDSGQFAFTASEAGNYMACFWMTASQPAVTVSIELDWKTGVAAKDWTKIAKRDKIDGMELELRKLEDYVTSIYDEMLHLRERGEEMRQLNEITSSRMAWFSLMSFLVCLSVAGWQLWHLKSFFERKKLL